MCPASQFICHLPLSVSLTEESVHTRIYTSLTLGSMSSVCGAHTTPAAIVDEVMKSNIYAYPLPHPALVSFIWGNGFFYFPVCHVTIPRVSRMCFIHLCNERHWWWRCCGWEHKGAFSNKLAPVLVQVPSKILGNLVRSTEASPWAEPLYSYTYSYVHISKMRAFASF